MLKKFFPVTKKRQDMRFLDAESYKYQQRTDRPCSLPNSDDEFIKVHDNPIDSRLEELEHPDSSSFLDMIRQVTSYTEPAEQNHEQNVDGYFDDSAKAKNSLGVFSDSKIYSALIQSVLVNFELNIQHFNHPSTFKPEKYDFFDGVSAWIIFLSDEEDNTFLDSFLDRYVDKPTLFLFSKLNKDAFVKRISQFVQQNDLPLVRAEHKV